MSGMQILQVAHDHPDWTPGGTEIVAHDLARALDARDGYRRPVPGRLHLAAAPWRGAGHPRRARPRPRAADRRLRPLLDDAARRRQRWIAALGQVLATVRPDIVHLHGLDRIGAEVIPVVRRLAPRAGSC